MAAKKLLVIFLYLVEINLIEKNISVNGLKDGDDLHSSVTALQEVFNTEKDLIENLASYIEGSEKNIDFIRSFLNDLKNDHDKFIKDVIEAPTVHDPLHMYLLKKRLTIDLKGLQTYLDITTTKNTENFTKTTKEQNIPNLDDLEGVTLGLLRVQEVYNISAEELANGIINGIDFGTKFSAFDCFLVGLKLRHLDFHYYAIEWYKMAITRIKEEGWKGILPKVDEHVLLDSLAYSQYLEGSLENAKAAIETVLKALQNNYDNENAVVLADNLKIFIKHLIDLRLGGKQSTSLDPPKGALSQHNLTELELLKRACRGQLKKSPKEERKLFCKYETENHPFLLIAPIKIEILNLSPRLVVAHDVMYDSEIEILKELSMEKLIRAGVWNESKGKGERSLVRTSKYAWFDNSTHPLMYTLNQRVYDITGLTMETAEGFQLMNYGIGGHYDIHADYFTEPTEENGVKPYGSYEFGNRIATVLFYMSDVAHGGGTVWPNIKVLTLPKKGAAAFWYNLFADGKPNPKSSHSACPIIAGSKWVINKWIRTKGQIFRKPCYKYPDHLQEPKM